MSQKSLSRRAMLSLSSAGLAVLAGCTSRPSEFEAVTQQVGSSDNLNSDTPTQVTTTETHVPRSSAEVLWLEFEEEGSSSGNLIGGRAHVQISGDLELAFCQASVNFLDNDGVILETGYDLVRHIKPGEIWEVYAPYVGGELGTVAEIELKLEPSFDAPPSKTPGLIFRDDKLAVLPRKGLNIIGILENTSDIDYDYLSVHGKWYDEDNVVLSTEFTSMNDFGPGDRWKFEVPLIDSWGSNYESRISSYDLLITQ